MVQTQPRESKNSRLLHPTPIHVCDHHLLSGSSCQNLLEDPTSPPQAFEESAVRKRQQFSVISLKNALPKLLPSPRERHRCSGCHRLIKTFRVEAEDSKTQWMGRQVPMRFLGAVGHVPPLTRGFILTCYSWGW